MLVGQLPECRSATSRWELHELVVFVFSIEISMLLRLSHVLQEAAAGGRAASVSSFLYIILDACKCWMLKDWLV